jgi:hypothetical protein
MDKDLSVFNTNVDKFLPSWYMKAMFEWTIKYLADKNILFVQSKGQMDVASANAMVKAIADAAVEYQCFYHLIDHRDTTFLFSLSDYYDRPAINEKLGVTRKFRTAMVFAELTKDTKFMETVFINRGYTLHHFTDIDKAKTWLNEK